jgi:hypothetical protein
LDTFLSPIRHHRRRCVNHLLLLLCRRHPPRPPPSAMPPSSNPGILHRCRPPGIRRPPTRRRCRPPPHRSAAVAPRHANLPPSSPGTWRLPPRPAPASGAPPRVDLLLILLLRAVLPGLLCRFIENYYLFLLILEIDRNSCTFS